MQKASLVVLISGTGSNLQAIIDAIENRQLAAEITAVISNRVGAGGLKYAAGKNIKTHVVDHKQYPCRESFDQALIQIIDPLKPDLVILAGFMRILSHAFIEHYAHRLLNIHPSLLPKYKGLNTHQQAIDNRETRHGASVHYVSAELDSGPVVIQSEVPVYASDTAETLAQRVLKVEHEIYPLAIKLHIEGRISFTGDRLYFDGQSLTAPLRWQDHRLILPAGISGSDEYQEQH